MPTMAVRMIGMRKLLPDSHWRSLKQKETQMEETVVADGVLPGGSKTESDVRE